MIRQKRNLVSWILCGILLLFSVIIYSGWQQLLFSRNEKTVTIGVFSDSYWEVENGYSYRILDDAAEVFEKMHPGVKVEYVSGIMKADYTEWLSEQILLGSAPDLFFVFPENFNDLVELGAVKNLEPLIKDDADFDQEAFYGSAYLCGQYAGSQYALPYECAPKLMFMNRSILAEEGIGIPRKDWTWDDFYDICQRVTKDTDGDGITDQFGMVGYSWQDAFESNGVELFSPDGKKCSLTGKQVEDAVVFVENLEKLNQGYSVTGTDFALGNVVFQPMSFSEYRAYRGYPLRIKKYFDFEWDCFPMPAGPEGDNVSSLDTLLLAMNRDTKNASLAWEFMKVLTCGEEVQEEIFAYSEGVSVLRKVTESDQTLQKLIEGAGEGAVLDQEILSSAVEHAAVTARFRNYDDAMAEVDRAMDEIIGGGENISTELIIWNRSINKKLKNSRW